MFTQDINQISKHRAHLVRQKPSFPSELAAGFSQDIHGYGNGFPLDEEEQDSRGCILSAFKYLYRLAGC